MTIGIGGLLFHSIALLVQDKEVRVVTLGEAHSYTLHMQGSEHWVPIREENREPPLRGI